MVSFVVTAHDEAPFVAACLASLAAQDGLSPNDFEIVFVDDRSGDGTGEAALAANVPNLRLISVDSYDPSRGLTARQAALDIAFRKARGQWIFVTDADAVADPSWARATLAALGRGRALAATGPLGFRPVSEGLFHRLLARLQTADGLFYGGACSILSHFGLSSGMVFGNAAFKRELYEAAGGFDGTGFSLTEDLSFARALHAMGVRTARLARPLVTVGASPSLAELFSRSLRVSAGGLSALSALIGAWMGSYGLLALASLFSPKLFPLFVFRALLGFFWLDRAGRRGGLPRSFRPAFLFYEPAAVLVGVLVMLRLVRPVSVEWAGVSYER